MKISVRQICFIMLMYTFVTKILVYPTSLIAACGRDLLFPALIDFTVQGVIVWAVSYLCSRTDETFFGLLEGTLGRTCARIIYGFFAAFFMLCTLIPLLEQKLYVHAIFYDTVPSLIVFLPFFFFSVYAAGKGFENIGRCADFCLPIFAVTVLFIFMMSVPEAKWDNLLPVLGTPVKSVFGGALGTAYRFAEPCYLLMFMGHFRYKKGDAARITLSYAGGALLTLFFLAVFYAIYGGIAVTRQFAVSKISLFFPAIDIIGRIDLIAMYALEIVMLFALVINMQLAVHCLELSTGYSEKAVLSLAVNAVFIILTFALNNLFNNLFVFYKNWMWIVFVLFANAAPLLAWALKRRDAK